MNMFCILSCLCVASLISCNKDTAPPVVVDDDLDGPISRPSSGYGANGTHVAGEQDFFNPGYPAAQATVFYPSDMSIPRPVIFYSHPYGGQSKEYNRGLYEFVARKGYILVFVPYPTFGVSVTDRYNTLWTGFNKAVELYGPKMDLTKVGFAGHSFGGGASIGLGYKAFTEKGWGAKGRFIFTMAPWYSYQITDPELENFPANTQFITQVYDDDNVNDHRMAIDIFKHISIPNSEKDFVYVKAGVINGYHYVADHAVPSSRTAYDAYDYHAVYRLLDALMDYSFNQNPAAKNTALGNGSAAQVTMPGYNGQTLPPLEVTDNPTPRFKQDKYEFKCGDPMNPRSDHCE
ncbi:alpha/beta hydrolase [Niabella sp. CC-SYL272]|uniref:alpha/beta hydrolase n=1 Tax=Niabella agricola TaxID=2891571 RepID=UPI001F2F9CC6|nr:alpha/beta hydrolase [Niabella agricola]MCF3107744.1 alpha/beta hydrolase [Niabella agricola]